MDKNTADATAQERISSGLPFVEALARRLASGMPHSIDLSDLVQDGMIGLIDAAHRFDESRGIKFETFAERRVRGAMIDALRRDAWPRGVRRMRRELESAREKLRHQLGCEPSLSDLADHMGTDEAQLGRTIVRINTIESTSPLAAADAVDGANLPPVLVPSEPPAPDKVCEHAEVRRRVRGAIAALPWRERTVIGRYYYSDLTMKQIGAEIGVNESRVSQLHTRAIRRLRERLGADLAPNALPTALDPAGRKQGGKLAMAKASLATTRAGERAPARGPGVTGRVREGRRTTPRAPRTRMSTRRTRPLAAIVARMPEQVAAAS
ncbi:MAG: FliA/WhiG family RNA polymerase sigma factor [Acidobacteria bacterium]|nr:FliA/WhiG family RNA polymerase sigma factor [Acidobacteriota bacterium]